MSSPDLKNIFLPTPSQAVVSAVISLLLYWVAFKDVIMAVLFGGAQDIQPYFNQSYQLELSRFSGLPVVDFLVKAVFWAGVGLVAYLIFLAISNLVIEARNEAVITTEYINKGEVQERFRKPLIQLGAAVGLAFALLISIIVLLPLWFGLFGSGLTGTIGLISILRLLAAVIAASLNLYLLWVFGQIVFAID